MGCITIIELDHERIEEIEQNKEEFLAQILKQMRSVQDFQQDLIGGKILATVKRENKNKRYKTWYGFKQYWSKTKSIPKRNR